MTIDISKLKPEAVLAALYNAAKAQGMGIAVATPDAMTLFEAKNLLLSETASRSGYFDYLKGRVMKVRISGDTLDPRLYDRDNGEGAAKRAIDSIR
ncbi:unnamed protein product [marine sediment metagenome]|uniref:Uncharacterized protein n=1 Tax=marine sediment metagenome TaxID=412755 RepID=X0SY46_9ZZZZ